MIHVGDCLEVMRALESSSVDAVVTDPPYHLTNRGGGPGKATDNPYTRARAGAASRGFMGKTWDGGDVAFRPETWAEVLRVAKPGAYLAAFGGTRTYHRLACAIEDAGWELRDSVLRGHMPQPEDCPWLCGWLYGSGFPKSHNGEWGGTALKPAWEPIILARKPLQGTVAANFKAHGTGGLNVDACRIPVTDDSYARNCSGDRGHADNRGRAMEFGMGAGSANAAGRWPANLVHDGSAEIQSVFPEEAGAFAPVRGTEPSRPAKNTYDERARGGGAFHGDNGSAARFFYCAKASGEDRNAGTENTHPTVKPTELMRWLCRLVTPTGGLVLDPFAGSGSTGRGAIAEGFRFVGIELDPDYARIAEARIRAMQPGLSLGVPA